MIARQKRQKRQTVQIQDIEAVTFKPGNAAFVRVWAYDPSSGGLVDVTGDVDEETLLALQQLRDLIIW